MEVFMKWLPSLLTIAVASLTFAVGYGKLKQEVTNMKEKHREDFDEVKAQHEKEIKELKSKFADNSKQHAELFKVSNETKTMVAEMRGFMFAKNQIMSEIKEIFSNKVG